MRQLGMGIVAATVVVAAVAITLLSYFVFDNDLYFVFLLAGPILTGALAARWDPPWLAAAIWGAAGLVVLVTDFVVAREDVLFHVVVALVTAGLAWGATFVARKLVGRRASATG